MINALVLGMVQWRDLNVPSQIVMFRAEYEWRSTEEEDLL